ncbi:hypothetical protein [Streptomyces sp. A012304]|uniref:hypothetical protein n=1 Tax=Streptomyces sp. A012304 TaxID=375446 RepID=UPI002231CD45|nr:hypothetical protein [Streptomyces sp. A012304]GKQ36899.1 hypothetical protein ALMP_34390 [Streptomyces sp. A012304]
MHQPAHRRTDAAVFVAVLVTGVVLVMSGRASAQDVAVLGSALSALYAAWQRPPVRKV